MHIRNRELIQNLKIGELWYSVNQEDWIRAEACYWEKVSDANTDLEKSLEKINPVELKEMNIERFCLFLQGNFCTDVHDTITNKKPKHTEDIYCEKTDNGTETAER